MGSQGPWTTARSQGKIPLVAAVLNFFFGLGYLYLGYKRVLGVPTIVFVIVAIVLYFVFDISTDGIMTFILAASLAIDGWQKGRADYHSGTTFVPRS